MERLHDREKEKQTSLTRFTAYSTEQVWVREGQIAASSRGYFSLLLLYDALTEAAGVIYKYWEICRLVQTIQEWESPFCGPLQVTTKPLTFSYLTEILYLLCVMCLCVCVCVCLFFFPSLNRVFMLCLCLSTPAHKVGPSICWQTHARTHALIRRQKQTVYDNLSTGSHEKVFSLCQTLQGKQRILWVCSPNMVHLHPSLSSSLHNSIFAFSHVK